MSGEQVNAAHDSADHLVKMANDINNFFRAEPVREDAVAGIANHIDKFWTKSMRRKMAAHGEEGLDELPRDALRRLAKKPQPHTRKTNLPAATPVERLPAPRLLELRLSVAFA
jgi:formate dehydrogenase subunit delta